MTCMSCCASAFTASSAAACSARRRSASACTALASRMAPSERAARSLMIRMAGPNQNRFIASQNTTSMAVWTSNGSSGRILSMAGPRLSPHLLGASRFFQGGRRRLLAELGVRFQRPVPLLGEEGDLPISVGPQVVSAAHRTLPLEDDTLVDDEARGRDVAEELARGTDLESLARRDVARHATVHHDGAPRDLRIDLGTLTDDQRILSRDLTLDVTLDPHRSLERDLAGYPASLAH